MGRIALVATAAVTAAWCMAARAEDLPKRRAGLWEVTITTHEGMRMESPLKQCVDDESDMLGQGMLVPGAACKQVSLKKAPQTYVVKTSCAFGQSTTRSTATISGDFNSSIALRLTSIMVGVPGLSPQKTVMTVKARFLGPCTADQRPGDTIMPDGFVLRKPETR
jgi:hypothetical protein